MKLQNIFFASVTALTFFSCAQEKQKSIAVTNSLDFKRHTEVISLSKEQLGVTDLNSIGIKDVESGDLQVTQLVDLDRDTVMDEILFQPMVDANATKSFTIVTVTEAEKPKTTEFCYSRFVPERTDDYTWENNRVAFRTFGPVAQKMVEDGVKGGTLSSGIDAWLKRVEYPIINLWYKRNDKKKGAYHKDHGEGLDNFHVGVSRGVGGTAVKVDTSYYFSKNFISYKTITTGPIRTSFELKYATWDANGKQIDETKRISLDYGQNLSRFEIDVNGTESISSGLTLHDKKGTVNSKNENFWISHWETLQDSQIGTGIVTLATYFSGSENYITSRKDESNHFLHLNVVDGKVIFYSGFGWVKSNQFKNQKDWEVYLDKFSKQINNPLKVEIK